MDRFEQIHRIVVKDLFKQMRNTCNFYFKLPVNTGGKPNKLIFADQERIFELNYENERIYEIVNYSFNPFQELPSLFIMNYKQTTAIVCDSHDSLYYNA